MTPWSHACHVCRLLGLWNFLTHLEDLYRPFGLGVFSPGILLAPKTEQQHLQTRWLSHLNHWCYCHLVGCIAHVQCPLLFQMTDGLLEWSWRGPSRVLLLHQVCWLVLLIDVGGTCPLWVELSLNRWSWVYESGLSKPWGASQ